MNLPGQFIGQDRVDAAVPLDAAEPPEGRRNDLDPEVTFTTFTGAGMPRVKAGLIDDREPFGCKRRYQFGPDGAGDGTVGDILGHRLLQSLNVVSAET